MRVRRLVLVGAVLPIVGLAGLPAAHAAGQDGVINVGEFVFYYNSNAQGSFADIKNAKTNLNCCTFLSAGNGQGQVVKNNAASVENYDPTRNARVYYNSDFAGPSDLVNAGTGRNLVNTYNENASFKWVS